MPTPHPFPTRPPFKKKENHWLSAFSYGLNILLVIGLFILLPKILSSAPAATPTLEAAAGETPVASSVTTPPPTPLSLPTAPPPECRFSTEQTTFAFTEPVRIPVECENLDWTQAEVSLLNIDGEPLPGDIAPQKEAQAIVLPPERLVGSFALRVSLYGEPLATFPFEVQPPELSLETLLDVQPRLDIVNHLEGLAEAHPEVADRLRGKYLILPGYSALALQDAYRAKGWELRVDLPPEEWEAMEGGIKLTEAYDRTRDALPVVIVLTGVYDQNGNPYTYTGALPLITQQPLQNIGKHLFVYNVSAGEFLNNKGQPAYMLSGVSNFKDVFGLDGAEITVGDKTYRFVMLIGEIKSGAYKQENDSDWQKFKDNYADINTEGNAAVWMVGGGTKDRGDLQSDCAGKDFFIVQQLDPKKNSYMAAKIALFGFVEVVQPAEEGNQ